MAQLCVMCGADVADVARESYAMYGTDLAYGATLCHADTGKHCHALCDADVAHVVRCHVRHSDKGHAAVAPGARERGFRRGGPPDAARHERHPRVCPV
eukprot:2117008-Rhodomonas_salina.1